MPPYAMISERHLHQTTPGWDRRFRIAAIEADCLEFIITTVDITAVLSGRIQSRYQYALVTSTAD